MQPGLVFAPEVPERLTFVGKPEVIGVACVLTGVVKATELLSLWLSLIHRAPKQLSEYYRKRSLNSPSGECRPGSNIKLR